MLFVFQTPFGAVSFRVGVGWWRLNAVDICAGIWAGFPLGNDLPVILAQHVL
jgi:hypothetical protein